MTQLLRTRVRTQVYLPLFSSNYLSSAFYCVQSTVLAAPPVREGSIKMNKTGPDLEILSHSNVQYNGTAFSWLLLSPRYVDMKSWAKNRTNANYDLLKGSQPSESKAGQTVKVEKTENLTQVLNLKETKFTAKKMSGRWKMSCWINTAKRILFWRGRILTLFKKMLCFLLSLSLFLFTGLN